jgi:hypothetical protein
MFYQASKYIAVASVFVLLVIAIPATGQAEQPSRQPGFFVRVGVGVNGTGQELTSPGSDSPIKITPADVTALAAIGFVITPDWTVVVESMPLIGGTFINGSGSGTTHWDGEADRTLFQVNWYPGDSWFLIGGAGRAKYDVSAIRDVANWFDTVLGSYAGETVFGAAGAGLQLSRSRKFATQVRALAFYYPETDMGAQTMAASMGYSVMFTADWFPF